MSRLLRSDRLATAILSWVAGYVDTAGFLRLNGLFTAHVTGNLVVAGAEIAGVGGEFVWVRLAVIPVFIAAVVITSAIARTRFARLSTLMWFEAATLLMFAGIGIAVIADRRQSIDDSTMFIVGSVGVFAMGVRNALMREHLGTLAPTTVMTGNLTQLAIDITQSIALHNREQHDTSNPQVRELHQRVGKFATALIGFVIGAACGAFLMRAIGFWSMILPAIATSVLAIDTQRHERITMQS